MHDSNVSLAVLQARGEFLDQLTKAQEVTIGSYQARNRELEAQIQDLLIKRQAQDARNHELETCYRGSFAKEKELQAQLAEATLTIATLRARAVALQNTPLPPQTAPLNTEALEVLKELMAAERALAFAQGGPWVGKRAPRDVQRRLAEAWAAAERTIADAEATQAEAKPKDLAQVSGAAANPVRLSSADRAVLLTNEEQAIHDAVARLIQATEDAVLSINGLSVGD